MSGFAQIGLSSRCGAPCCRAPGRNRAEIQKSQNIIYLIVSLAKRRAVRGARFILTSFDPCNNAKIGWRHEIRRVRGRVSPGKIRLQDITCRCATARSPAGDKAGKLIQPDSDANPKTPATFVSHWKQARSDTGRALEKPVGPNPGRLSRASHRPARRDRPCG